MMDEFESYRQVISMAGPAVEIMAPDDSDVMARIANDSLAELVEKYPHYFIGAVASLPLDRPEPAVRELQRAVGDLHVIGVQLYTNVNGKPLDSPEFRPLFQAISELDVPILLHPARSKTHPDYLTEDSSKYLIWQIFGWPCESSAAMARMVFSGMLDEFPSLKIVVHHTGAMVSFFSGRIQALCTLFAPLVEKEREKELGKERHAPLRQPAQEYFRRFYTDTSTFTTASIECAASFFDPSHILFGTDAPFDNEGGRFSIRESSSAIENSTLSPADKSKIFHANFESLFRQPRAVPAA
jgi:predicted TIM-barrel fold metal-dependent hydrolase